MSNPISGPLMDSIRELERLMRGDTNIDDLDFRLAMGMDALEEDEFSDKWKESYGRYLDDLYEKDRQRRLSERKGRG